MRCRLSRRSVTYTRGTAAPAPLPAPQPYLCPPHCQRHQAYCALDLTCAALEPRPTHHLLVAPAPAQAFAGTALLAFLPTQRPSTSRANASLFPAAGASRTNCSTLIAEPKLLVIITNVTIGPGTTAFVSPDATSRIAASALAAGHPRRHRPHRRRHLCLHPPSALPPPPYAFATLTSPTVTASTLIPTTTVTVIPVALFKTEHN